jgi:hypothetical protein
MGVAVLAARDFVHDLYYKREARGKVGAGARHHALIQFDICSEISENREMAKSASKQLVVCIDNAGYPASLETRKLYVMLPDPAAEEHGLVRIIDESGEDYLYPKAFFRSVDLPRSVKKAVLSAV